ncbi:ABC transporter permease [Kribbella sp. NPDC002412]
MSTPLRTTYPVPVEDLIPAARKLADDLGSVPSRNRIMKEFRIGADKARSLLDALTEPTPEPAEAPAEPHLHSVPSPDTADHGGMDDMTPAPEEGASPQVTPHTDPVPTAEVAQADVARAAEAEEDKPIASWPVWLLALPAFVAVWSGWVGLGEMTGFGVVHPLPGIADGFTLNTAITLPIGVETYAAFALHVWLSGRRVAAHARRFAMVSALSALGLGALGQVAYHLLDAAGVTVAPWPITTAVACLPVAVLGMGAALAHLIHTRPTTNGEN